VPTLARQIVAAALELGFVRAGVTDTRPLREGRERLRAWIEAGHHGPLDYMTGADRADPKALLEVARSMVVVALAYPRPTPVRARRDGPALGAVAAYARGADYHRVMKDKLALLAERVHVLAGRRVRWRPVVDTAPLLEREAAVRAGLGFIGKSTMLIVPGLGTQVLLGELLLDLELEPSQPATGSCGECRACLDACPTGAIVAPFSLDARRCISLHTIEHHGTIPRELRPLLGNHVFGCDVCQAVCPYVASPSPRPSAPELAGRVAPQGFDLVALLEAGNGAHRTRVKRTALRRVSRNVLARNAAVAMGNARDPSFLSALERALDHHPSALVRAHAAWALGQYVPESRARLEHAAEHDPDPAVRAEARAALGEPDGGRART
jgi:epoxyqueuosine reductase